MGSSYHVNLRAVLVLPENFVRAWPEAAGPAHKYTAPCMQDSGEAGGGGSVAREDLAGGD